MQGKAKLLSTVTFISSFIAAALVLSYILGFGIGLELGVLFIAITEMLIGIGQYEISRHSNDKHYKIMADLSFFIGIIILLIIILIKIK